MSVRITFDGRAGVWYERDGKRIRIHGEVLANGVTVIYDKHVGQWDTAGTAEPASAEEWSGILGDVEAFLERKHVKYILDSKG